MIKILSRFFTVMSVFLMVFLFQNCGGDTITGNPYSGVDIQLQGYNSSASTGTAKLQPAVSSSNQQGVNKVSILSGAFALDVCVEFIRFKYYYSRNPDIYDPDRNTGVQEIGPASIVSSGTSLGRHQFENGEYNQIEISFGENYLWSPCGYRMRLTNDFGTFYARTAIYLIYQGTYVVNNELNILELPTQDLVDAMKEVNADAEACLIDPARADCLACTADSTGPGCKTIERLVEERGLGIAYP